MSFNQRASCAHGPFPQPRLPTPLAMGPHALPLGARGPAVLTALLFGNWEPPQEAPHVLTRPRGGICAGVSAPAAQGCLGTEELRSQHWVWDLSTSLGRPGPQSSTLTMGKWRPQWQTGMPVSPRLPGEELKLERGRKGASYKASLLYMSSCLILTPGAGREGEPMILIV